MGIRQYVYMPARQRRAKDGTLHEHPSWEGQQFPKSFANRPQLPISAKRRNPLWPGVHALEEYVPRHCVSMVDLEVAHNVIGKYTMGLMMRESTACDEDEDAVSMALSATHQLFEVHGLKYEDVGMAQVGSESLLDRSKSMKSHIMSLFEPHGCANVEGVDQYHACYGGTAALLACTNWIDSTPWDGRWALSICSDVSDAPEQYAFMSGAAAVVMLVGPHAPLALEGPRVTRVLNEWDFYKPIGWPSMSPIINGPQSMRIYFDCFGACQSELAESGDGVLVDSVDSLVFHLGGGPKFVRHALEHAIEAAHGHNVVSDTEVGAHFARRVEPSLKLAARIGTMHTAATYVNMCSLLLHGELAAGAHIGVFSFGSGAASTLYQLILRGTPRADTRLAKRLDARTPASAADFAAVCKRYISSYGRFDWAPNPLGWAQPRSFCIERVSVMGIRQYVQPYSLPKLATRTGFLVSAFIEGASPPVRTGSSVGVRGLASSIHRLDVLLSESAGGAKCVRRTTDSTRLMRGTDRASPLAYTLGHSADLTLLQL